MNKTITLVRSANSHWVPAAERARTTNKTPRTLKLHTLAAALGCSALASTYAFAAPPIVATQGQTVNATDADIAVSRDGAYALHSEGDGALIDFRGGHLTAAGQGAGAAQARGGTIHIGANEPGDGTVIQSQANNAYALWAREHGHLSVAGATITTEGTRTGGALGSSAVVASTNSTVDVVDTSIRTSGAWSEGVTAEGAGSVMNVTRSSIVTTGDGAKAAVAYNGGGELNLNEVDITTTGANARGVVAGQSSRAEIQGGRVQTQGVGSFGLHALAKSSIAATGTEVTTTGTNAHGVYAADSEITLNDVAVVTQGANAAGVVAEAALGSKTSVVLDNTSVDASATAFDMRGKGTSTITLESTQAAGGNGALLMVGEGTASFIVGDSTLRGDMISNSGGKVDVELSAGTDWTGAAHKLDSLSVRDSAWTMTADSTVGQLGVHNGVVAFAAPAADQFKTLTVDGNYDGQGATLVMNTRLGDDSSPTDRLVVHGDTGGHTFLKVHNAGGAGAFTQADGIQVVQVDGASNGQFELEGRVVAGAREYLLAQGGKADPTNGDWYLRSEVPVKPEEPKTEEPKTEEPKTPLYRPETGAYLSNQAAAAGMFQHTLHERLGEVDFSERQRQDGMSKSAWARVERNQFDGKTGADQIQAHTDTSVLQVGAELATWSDGDSRAHFGVMGGIGQANSRVESNVDALSDQAKGQVKGKSLGAYGTWYQNASKPTGAYVDTWVQYGDFDHSVHGDRLHKERYDSQTLTGSVEAGYAIELGQSDTHGVYLEPQAQVIYTDYRGGDHVEAGGTHVTADDAGGLTTRLGTRVYTRAIDANANRVQPFVEANWWHSDANNRVGFDGEVLRQDRAKDVYELKGGAQVQLGGGWTGWGELGLQAPEHSDEHTVSGLLGVKRSW